MKGIRSQDEFQDNPGKGNSTILLGVKIKLNKLIALFLVFVFFLFLPVLPDPDALRSVFLPVSISGYLHSLGSRVLPQCVTGGGPGREGSGKTASLPLCFPLVLFLEKQLVLWGEELFSEVEFSVAVSPLKDLRCWGGREGWASAEDAFLRPAEGSEGSGLRASSGEGPSCLFQSRVGCVPSCCNTGVQSGTSKQAGIGARRAGQLRMGGSFLCRVDGGSYLHFHVV